MLLWERRGPAKISSAKKVPCYHEIFIIDSSKLFFLYPSYAAFLVITFLAANFIFVL